jgi:hypothetical protein
MIVREVCIWKLVIKLPVGEFAILEIQLQCHIIIQLSTIVFTFADMPNLIELLQSLRFLSGITDKHARFCFEGHKLLPRLQT